jgi:outer membrane protein assembly factor BamA
LAKQPDFLHVDGAIMLDYRDRPGNPHKGGMAGVFVSRFDDRRSNAFEFTRIAFETRQFLPLGSEQRVLALRLFASTDEVDAGSRVPFYFQETLGGSETLRGFREFRFRDRRTFYGSTEYRWEAAAFMELALFYDVGQVYGSGVKLAWDRLETSYGGGLRFKTPRAVILRMDVGHSREGTRFYFKFGPSF